MLADALAYAAAAARARPRRRRRHPHRRDAGGAGPAHRRPVRHLRRAGRRAARGRGRGLRGAACGGCRWSRTTATPSTARSPTCATTRTRTRGYGARVDHRGAVPARVHRGAAVGAPRHRRHRPRRRRRRGAAARAAPASACGCCWPGSSGSARTGARPRRLAWAGRAGRTVGDAGSSPSAPPRAARRRPAAAPAPSGGGRARCGPTSRSATVSGSRADGSATRSWPQRPRHHDQPARAQQPPRLLEVRGQVRQPGVAEHQVVAGVGEPGQHLGGSAGDQAGARRSAPRPRRRSPGPAPGARLSVSMLVSTPSGTIPRSSQSPLTPVPVPISTTARARSRGREQAQGRARRGADRLHADLGRPGAGRLQRGVLGQPALDVRAGGRGTGLVGVDGGASCGGPGRSREGSDCRERGRAARRYAGGKVVVDRPRSGQEGRKRR